MRSDQVPVDSELLPLHLHLDVPAALWNLPTSCSSCTGLGRRPVWASLTPLVEVRTAARGSVCSTLAKAGTRLLMWKGILGHLALRILRDLLILLECQVLEIGREWLVECIMEDRVRGSPRLIQYRFRLDVRVREWRECAGCGGLIEVGHLFHVRLDVQLAGLALEIGREMAEVCRGRWSV